MDEYQQLLMDAHDALAEGSWKTAVALATEAQMLKPGSMEALLLHANALMDGGLFAEASDVLDKAEVLSPDDPLIVTNRGICTFELCRFDSARDILEFALELDNRMADAHYYLGLVLERQGDWVEANKRFAKATELDPESFSPPVQMDDEEFISLVESATLELPPEAIQLLENITIEVQLLPDEEDLLAFATPMSPQILGMKTFDSQGKAKSVVLFQRNLQRMALDKSELKDQIRITIQYELQNP